MKDIMKAEIKVAAAWKKVSMAQTAREKVVKGLAKTTAAKLDGMMDELNKTTDALVSANDGYERALRDFVSVLNKALKSR